MAERNIGPDAIPQNDESEFYDEAKHENRTDQQRPEREKGFAAVDKSISGRQGERFDEKLPEDAAERTPRDRSVAAGEGAELSGVETESETELALEEAANNNSPEPGPRTKIRDEDEVDEAIEETFPASDPPAWSPGTADPSNLDKPEDEDQKT